MGRTTPSMCWGMCWTGARRIQSSVGYGGAVQRGGASGEPRAADRCNAAVPFAHHAPGREGAFERCGTGASVRIGSKRRELLQLLQLSEAEIETVCKYLPKLSAYEEVTAQGRPFVLVHAGLDHFSPARPLAEYDLEDFPFCRLDLNTAYFPDNPPSSLVFGHTPHPAAVSAGWKTGPHLPSRHNDRN